jgi:DNA anti-recombination protein RmuC
MFDTLRLAKRMEKGGVSAQIAEAIASSLADEFSENVVGEIRGMESRMDDRFDGMNARFEEMSARMDTRFEEMNARMDKRFEEANAGTNKRLDEANTRTNERFDAMRREMRMLFGIALAAVLIPIVELALKLAHIIH